MRFINTHSFLRNQLPIYLYILLIFTLSSIPPDSMPDTESQLPFDKVAHFTEYGIFGILLFRFINSRNKISTLLAVILTIVSAAFIGALDEFYQFFTGRHSDFYDWVFDCLGAATGTLVYFFYFHKRKSKPDEAV
ncbi:teicoplanin resistance protein VanZ [Candidatus Poribacteria bacterium]|nr:teicoplanin resistance protein VanZ [Candidatus Poribacteria bacterium]